MALKTPSMDEMLNAGVHFGHVVSKWHPKAEKYIYTIKNNIHIIDLSKTKEALETASKKIDEIIEADKKILFVGTRKQVRDITKETAESCGMPYMNVRWIGGMFTNFKTVLKSIQKLNRLEEEKENGGFDKYTKKERLSLSREIERLNRVIGGIKNMKQLPGAVFIFSSKYQKTAILESTLRDIPTIALTDTNTNPDVIDISIPANDEAISSLRLIGNFIASKINESKNKKA